MSYREDVKDALLQISVQITADEAQIDRVIRQVYAQALEEAKRTGGSVESMTYEVLEGIEEGLSHTPDKIEPTLQRASLLMADLLHHSAEEDIARSRRRVDFAREAYEQIIEAEKMHLIESLDAFKAYAREHHYVQFQKSLHLTGSAMMQHVLTQISK